MEDLNRNSDVRIINPTYGSYALVVAMYTALCGLLYMELLV
jgi:hypothetical protein